MATKWNPVTNRIDSPLNWLTPRRVIVSDVFHEDVPDEFIAAVFGIMAACPQHDFQMFTNNAERMKAWFELADDLDICGLTCAYLDRAGVDSGCGSAFDPDEWPPQNVAISED